MTDDIKKCPVCENKVYLCGDQWHCFYDPKDTMFARRFSIKSHLHDEHNSMVSENLDTEE